MDYTHIPVISCFYSDDADKPSIRQAEAHFEYEMILVTGGSGTAVIGPRHYPIGKKSLIFISRMERHYFVIDQKPYERYVASMSSDLILSNIRDMELVSIFIQRPKEFCHCVQLSDEAYEMLLPLFARLEKEFIDQRAFYVSRSVSLIVAILIDLYRTHPEAFPVRSHSNASDAVLNAQRYINDHYSEHITLQDIASANYVSRHTLSLAFKDIAGISFKEYLILFRLTEAKRLLVTTDLSVSEIAVRVGYGNVNNFVQMFRAKESLTPLQYRKRFAALPADPS